MSEAIRHTDTHSFTPDVVNSDRPVLVDFYADWCGPCQAIAPIVEEISASNQDRLDVRKVDVDANGELAARFGVRGIPTLILFKDGEPAETLVGLQSRADIQAVVDAHAS